eukprot:Pgem_evm1s18141
MFNLNSIIIFYFLLVLVQLHCSVSATNTQTDSASNENDSKYRKATRVLSQIPQKTANIVNVDKQIGIKIEERIEIIKEELKKTTQFKEISLASVPPIPFMGLEIHLKYLYGVDSLNLDNIDVSNRDHQWVNGVHNLYVDGYATANLRLILETKGTLEKEIIVKLENVKVKIKNPLRVGIELKRRESCTLNFENITSSKFVVDFGKITTKVHGHEYFGKNTFISQVGTLALKTQYVQNFIIDAITYQANEFLYTSYHNKNILSLIPQFQYLEKHEKNIKDATSLLGGAIIATSLYVTVRCVVDVVKRCYRCVKNMCTETPIPSASTSIDELKENFCVGGCNR